MAIVTAKELNDAGEDAKTVGEMANGAAGAQVKSRLGRIFYTLATYDKKFADSVIKYDQTLTKYDQIFTNQVTAYDQTLVKYDKLFADRVVTCDQTLTKKVTEFDTSRNAQVKKYDDTLVLKINEFDTSRNAQVLKYNNALDVKIAEFDTSRNAQVTKYDNALVLKINEFDTSRNAQVAKYDKTLDAKVVEYDIKIRSVDADLRKAIDTANTANTNAAAAKTTADAASVTANKAEAAVAGKLDKAGLEPILYAPIPYAKNIAPTGFLIMLGQSISQVTYPILYSLYGATLPDLRGQFLRGLDYGKGIDAGRTVLSAQADTFKAHGHFYSSGFVGFNVNGGSQSTSATAPVDKTTGETGGAETRPKNIAFLYIVKAG